jgi:hypothetical protein
MALWVLAGAGTLAPSGGAALAQGGFAQASLTQSSLTLTSLNQTALRPVRMGGATEVYLLRGLFNVFSLGMDELQAKLIAAGVQARVHNHAEWAAIAEHIIARRARHRLTGQPSGRIVLIGHSLGGNDVVKLAAR